MTEREYARYAQQRLEKAGYGPFTFNRREFTLRGPDGKDAVYLSLTYGEHKKNGVPAPRLIADLIAALGRNDQMPKTWAAAQGSILPYIRPRSSFWRSDHAHRAFGTHFAVMLYHDYPESRVPLSGETLRDWQVTWDDAYAQAVINLRTMTPVGLEPVRNEDGMPMGGMWAGPWEDSYAPARLLLPEVMERCPVLGRPVAMLGHERTLGITGEDDLVGVSWLAGCAEGVLREPRVQSCVPVV
jgi:hypothetical protein